MRLPGTLRARYQLATGNAIRSWSFGAIKRPSVLGKTRWQNLRGTLDDPRIFGPTHDFRCPCGRYDGEKYRGIICDRCGVKVTTRSVRRRRFAHINLTSLISHPLGGADTVFDVLPVLPVGIVNSRLGQGLRSLYERIVIANERDDTGEIARCYTQVCQTLLPVLEMLHGWRLPGARVIARGMALVPSPAPAPDNRAEAGVIQVRKIVRKLEVIQVRAGADTLVPERRTLQPPTTPAASEV